MRLRLLRNRNSGGYLKGFSIHQCRNDPVCIEYGAPDSVYFHTPWLCIVWTRRDRIR